jgi:putative membrane-bound dehydrogenase-like protein
MQRRSHLLAALFLAFGTSAALAADPKPLFDSKTISTETPGHGVNIDVDLKGAKELWLVVTDAGDGIGCDWADWAEPRLVGPSGETKLTALKWKAATTGFGEVRVDANVGGNLMRINGKAFANGLGTHAPSIIGYDLPAGVTRFRARAGIDNGGSDQGGGSTVQFLVFTQKPPARLANAASSGGGGHELAKALEGLEVAPGLEATLFAGEPMLLSPADIDVDHKGRVWVCEVVNYRGRSGQRPEGDRILILEDTNQDGIADKQTVFYQGRDIDSALGICVLGNKVIVSVAPNVFVFTDEDGDGKADKKEVLFSKVGTPQHDHSTHAFVFGPDGKLYWNVGNEGHAVHDKNGKPIVDKAGNVVNDSGKPYRQGMVFRCNQDGSGFETLAHNFRNNYEVAVDSFGTLWQSDNDDDGNRGVRINYVMEFGNYGYTDEMTGAGWSSPRTNIEVETPLRHWHLNDPGVVPNLLQTGGGSPTGICIYEGALLPEVFQNQIIHCDAGPNVVRAYPVTERGAGYSARIENILEGTRDKWFRPSDVCVAPDGSLIVADWYDPGVGGHGMGDIDKGRIFRIAPPGAKYNLPKFDVSTVEGAITALESPNQDARYLAWTALHDFGIKAEPSLAKRFREDPNPRFRARALWLLSQLSGKGADYLKEAVNGKQDDLKVVAIRAGRELSPPWRWMAGKVAAESPMVRRELAIALVGDPSPGAEWAKLAEAYQGDDRWSLEALGIAASKHWDECLSAYLKAVPDAASTKAGRDIIWRSRAARTPELLAKLIDDPSTPSEELPRLFRSLDFQTGEGKRAAIEQLAFHPSTTDEARWSLIGSEAVKRLEGSDLSRSPEKRAAIETVLNRVKGTPTFVMLVDRYELKNRYPDLIALATSTTDGSLAVDAVEVLLRRGQREILSTTLGGSDVEAASALARVLGRAGDRRATPLLVALVDDKKTPQPLAVEAARALAKTPPGARELLRRIKDKSLATDLSQTVAFALQTSSFDDSRLKREIEALFPPPPARNEKPLPPLAVMLRSRGDTARGKVVFRDVAKCNACHVVDGEGKEVGPNLSEIGSKLSREGFFEAILYPSAAISHNYETWSASTVDGNVVSGIKVSETPSEIILKGIDSVAHTLKKSEIDELKKQEISLMPADLQKMMTAQELIDVIEYVQTLKKR